MACAFVVFHFATYGALNVRGDGAAVEFIGATVDLKGVEFVDCGQGDSRVGFSSGYSGGSGGDLLGDISHES